MPLTSSEAFPHVDAATQECITDEQAEFFRNYGLLVIRRVLRGDELKAMQEQTLPLAQRAVRERVNDPDYFYRRHDASGRETPFRIEYIIDKTAAGKALLGHPFILNSVEKLQGRNFIPTWDSMVFKTEGAGAIVEWHRDGGTTGDMATQGAPIFNVDFYLDVADLSNCLWGVLGSNRWSPAEAQEKIAQLNSGGFNTDEMTVPIPMQPGDVIFHNVLALHGSPPSQSKLRRVVYLEFRPAEVERAVGPHNGSYIPIKQKVLLACLRDRAATSYAKGEKPFVYQPSSEFAAALAENEKLDTYRVPHEKYWRSGSYG